MLQLYKKALKCQPVSLFMAYEWGLHTVELNGWVKYILWEPITLLDPSHVNTLSSLRQVVLNKYCLKVPLLCCQWELSVHQFVLMHFLLAHLSLITFYQGQCMVIIECATVLSLMSPQGIFCKRSWQVHKVALFMCDSLFPCYNIVLHNMAPSQHYHFLKEKFSP